MLSIEWLKKLKSKIIFGNFMQNKEKSAILLFSVSNMALLCTYVYTSAKYKIDKNCILYLIKHFIIK